MSPFTILKKSANFPPNIEKILIDYVNKEIDHALRDKPGWHFHYKLDPTFNEFPATALRIENFRWKIFPENDPYADYGVSITSDMREILIWFGNGEEGPPNPGNAVNYALHIEIGSLIFYRGSLADIVSHVILHPCNFPLNREDYT
jgi:hypothetical protein